MVIYAAAVGASIGGLFIAGVIPGIIIGLALMLVVYIISVKRKYPYRTEQVTLKEFFIGLKDATSALIMPSIILGGILGGIFTPTEASSVAVACAFLLTVFVYKEVKFRDIPEMLKETAVTTAIVLILVSTSNVFSYIIMMEQIAPKLSVFFGSTDKMFFY
jgi:C4-dicarboxylate transporter DctM subunit